jgi:hypothetical protein
MTIAQMTARIQTFGTDASFVANVILTQHRNRARKLKGVIALLTGGHDVRTGQFDIDGLIVDGKSTPWQFLETSAAHFPHHHPEAFGGAQ